MKKLVISILITIFIIYCIVYPTKMAVGVAYGLSLWYHNVLPTLLPFSILSYIIIHSNLYHALFSKISKMCKNTAFETELLYPIVFGFFFGFPIGAKLIADLYEIGHLSDHNISKYAALCTQFGPAFVINYIGNTQLHNEIPSFYLLLCIYLPSILCMLGLTVFETIQHLQDPSTAATDRGVGNKIPVSRSYLNFKIIDTGIINGFETMLRIAGYIVLFSILSEAINMLPGQHAWFSSLVTGLLEVTTGVNKCATSQLPYHVMFCFICGIVSFGGFCGMFQVKAIMKHCPFRLTSYIVIKTICALSSIGLALLCINL